MIGRKGTNIPASRAMDHVWGYTIVNDVTARDVQMRHVQWDMGKSFDTFCPMGPWLVDATELDGRNTRVRLWVNGDELPSSGRIASIGNGGRTGIVDLCGFIETRMLRARSRCSQTRKPMSAQIIPVQAFDLVVFGGTGDLSVRKLMPALYHRDRDGQLPAEARVIGLSRKPASDEAYRSRIAEGLERHVPSAARDPTFWLDFSADFTMWRSTCGAIPAGRS